MTTIPILLILIAMPWTAFADCIITDTPYKFEVVCSGSNKISTPIASKSNTKTAKGPSKAKKADYEGREIVTATIAMNEEESQFMQTRNSQDGYQAKRNPKSNPQK